MVSGCVITAAVLLCILVITELVHIILVPAGYYKDDIRGFNIIVYEKNDEMFEEKLRDYIRQLKWRDTAFADKIYIVHMNVPEIQSAGVREMCRVRSDLVYLSIDEFIKIVCDDKNSPERDCILSENEV